MTSQPPKNPYDKSFEKSVKAQSRKPKSLAEMQKPNKFQLTSKKEYQIIKQGIYNKIADSNKVFAIMDFLTNTLQMSVDPINNEEQQISLLSSLYVEDPKLQKLAELAVYKPYFKIYLEKSNLYFSRLEVMQKIHGLLPQIVSEIAIDIIKKYVSLGFNAAYSIVPIQTCLENISLELINEFKSSVEDYNKTNNTTQLDQPKYKPFADFHPNFILFNTQLKSGFKTAYMLYKQYLTLILETNYLLSGNSAMYYKHKIMQYIESGHMPLQPMDHHMFLQLIRVQLAGPYPNDLYPFPILSPDQAHQLASYLEEIINLVFINIIVSEKYSIPQNIFTALPLSLTIKFTKIREKINKDTIIPTHTKL